MLSQGPVVTRGRTLHSEAVSPLLEHIFCDRLLSGRGLAL